MNHCRGKQLISGYNPDDKNILAGTKMFSILEKSYFVLPFVEKNFIFNVK